MVPGALVFLRADDNVLISSEIRRKTESTNNEYVIMNSALCLSLYLCSHKTYVYI